MSRKRAKSRGAGRDTAPAPDLELRSERRPRGRAGHWAAAALVLLAVLVAYEPSLRAPFYFDDYRNIVHNPILRDLSWFARPWAVDASARTTSTCTPSRPDTSRT
jgi:hypothetical protein